MKLYNSSEKMNTGFAGRRRGVANPGIGMYNDIFPDERKDTLSLTFLQRQSSWRSICIRNSISCSCKFLNHGLRWNRKADLSLARMVINYGGICILSNPWIGPFLKIYLVDCSIRIHLYNLCRLDYSTRC